MKKLFIVLFAILLLFESITLLYAQNNSVTIATFNVDESQPALSVKDITDNASSFISIFTDNLTVAPFSASASPVTDEASAKQYASSNNVGKVAFGNIKVIFSEPIKGELTKDKKKKALGYKYYRDIIIQVETKIYSNGNVETIIDNVKEREETFVPVKTAMSEKEIAALKDEDIKKLDEKGEIELDGTPSFTNSEKIIKDQTKKVGYIISASIDPTVDPLSPVLKSLRKSQANLQSAIDSLDRAEVLIKKLKDMPSTTEGKDELIKLTNQIMSASSIEQAKNIAKSGPPSLQEKLNLVVNIRALTLNIPQQLKDISASVAELPTKAASESASGMGTIASKAKAGKLKGIQLGKTITDMLPERVELIKDNTANILNLSKDLQERLVKLPQSVVSAVSG